MDYNLTNLNAILALAQTFCRNNPYYTQIWLFLRYAQIRLNRLSNVESTIRAIPDKVLENFMKKLNKSTECIDEAHCALGKLDGMKNNLSPKWYYICSKISHRKYKVLIVPYDDCKNNKIIISETMLFNMENALHHSLDRESYFVIPVKEERSPCAAKASVSMLSNPSNCSDDLIDSLLSTYFETPKYLRARDIFGIDVHDYAPDFFYSTANPSLTKVYFRVNFLTIKYGDKLKKTSQGCYIVREETTLVQAAHVNSYLPREFVDSIGTNVQLPLSLQIERCSITNCPPLLEESLSSLEACVTPFLQKDRRMKIRPVFLVKGEPGSGKFKLIQTLARRNGLNLLNVDFAEVQALSAVQTETKIRIVLQNARNSGPCVLKLSNIQIFGKNSEGQKDERIVSAFAAELQKLNDVSPKHPLIVIATLENDELDGDIERLFIETVSIEHPAQARRAETLSWLLAGKGLEHDANLTKIADLVSDFRLADLEALFMQTAKIAYQYSVPEKKSAPPMLTQIHFVEACEKMQSAFSERVGAPRIPVVNWDDIGGLANLKHEIKRRIELPMFEKKMGLGKSGLLLWGPPGTGKTLLAKAVATECQLHFMSIKGPELLNMYVGQSEKNVRQVFERARAAAPCVIFFDELDSLAPNRGRSGDSGGVMDRVVSQLLAEMDGLESAGLVFIIGATNRPDLIDPALLRPGRFDKMLYVGIYSDRESQLSVLRAVTRRFKMKDNGSELEKLVQELPTNLTGADLYAVCSDAWLLAVRRNIVALEQGANDDESVARGCHIVVELGDFVEAATNLEPSVSSVELARYERMAMELSWTK